LQYRLHVQYCMWYCNTFRTEVLQYLEAIQFDIEYTINHQNHVELCKKSFHLFCLIVWKRLSKKNMSTQLVCYLNSGMTTLSWSLYSTQNFKKLCTVAEIKVYFGERIESTVYGHSRTNSMLVTMMWHHGITVMHWIESMKLLYSGPGYYLDGWLLWQFQASQLGRLSLLHSVGWWSEYYLLGWEVINGDGECSAIATSLGLVQILVTSSICAALATWTRWTLAVAVHCCHTDSTRNVVIHLLSLLLSKHGLVMTLQSWEFSWISSVVN